MPLQKVQYKLQKFSSLENIVLTVAVLIAISWVWGTMSALQDNYRLQGQVNQLKQTVKQSQLEADNLALENQYYASAEYQELEARARFNKAASGEHLLILPPNTPVQDKEDTTASPFQASNNFKAWLDFFFGKK